MGAGHTTFGKRSLALSLADGKRPQDRELVPLTDPPPLVAATTMTAGVDEGSTSGTKLIYSSTTFAPDGRRGTAAWAARRVADVNEKLGHDRVSRGFLPTEPDMP